MAIVLGLDYGKVRIGVAVSDALGISANGLQAIKHTTEQRDLVAIDAIIKERTVDRVVVGLPMNMDGSEGPMAEEARQFAGKVAGLGVEVVMWDERMSSMAAESALLEADMTRKKRKGKRDQVAAAWFLQSYLDANGMGAIELLNE